MGNSYTQIFLHIVFAVQNRQSLISINWKHDLYKYITGIVQNNGHKLIAINGMPNHLHLAVGFKPNQSISDLLKDIKGDSSKWINSQRFMSGHFNWQEGYGAFSFSQSQIDSVVKYIQNQEEHHRKKTFREEYIEFLTKYNVDYNEKYLLEDVE